MNHPDLNVFRKCVNVYRIIQSCNNTTMVEYILYICVCVCMYVPQRFSYVQILLPSVVLLCWTNPLGKCSDTAFLTLHIFPCYYTHHSLTIAAVSLPHMVHQRLLFSFCSQFLRSLEAARRDALKLGFIFFKGSCVYPIHSSQYQQISRPVYIVSSPHATVRCGDPVK